MVDESKLAKDCLVFLTGDDKLIGCISDTRLIGGAMLTYTIMYYEESFKFITTVGFLIDCKDGVLTAEDHGEVKRLNKEDFKEYAMRHNFKYMLPVNETMDIC